jgi:hypothetical protein
MPVEMAMWKMTSDGPLAIAPKKLNFEDRLAELVVNDPSLIRIAAINAAAGLPGRRAAAGRRSGAGADRGGSQVLPSRAWPGAD